MSNIELRQLLAFARSVAAVITDVPRVLDKFGLSDEASEALDIETEQIRQLRVAANSYSEMAKALPGASEEFLDKLALLFEQTRQCVAEFYCVNAAKRQAAVDNSGHSSDGLVDAYDLLLSEIRALHDCLNEIAWVLGEHAADLSERAPGEYTNAHDLFRALDV